MLKGLFESDFDDVFFDGDEFGIEIILMEDEKEPQTIKAIFDTNSELIFDNATEFGESVATVPSILLREADTKNISHSSIFIIEDERYKMTYKNREDTELTRIYLEKRR